MHPKPPDRRFGRVWNIAGQITPRTMKTLSLRLSLLFFITIPFAATSAAPERIEDLYNPKLAPFYHGVASGDPLQDGFIIWTRVTDRGKAAPDKIRVLWAVAKDPEMKNVVAKGETFATSKRDYTVKVDVRGLPSGQTFFYRFKALGRSSQVGRTKTTPNVAVDQLEFAVVSCANYEWGYFAGYDHIARRGELDAVIHLGDYIYEYPDNDSYSSEKIRDERVLFPSRETVFLKDYRKRYATYRLDPQLQRCHRRHPFIVIWDDHEFANDAWEHGAANHQKKTEGSWKDRKAKARRAFLEWMPIRENGNRIYRVLSYGPLMDLILLDTRVDGRDKQIRDVTNPNLYDPGRTILGGTQKDWLKDQLSASTATWKVLGNQVVFSEFNIGFAADADPIISPDIVESLFLDIWDGYPAERNELVKYLANTPIDNTVILTGDIHASFAFEVADPAFDNPNYDPETGAGAVAVEFVTPSLTAANFDEETADFFSESLESRINSPDEDTGINPNPHMKYADLDRHGYIVLTVQEEQVQADYYYIRNILKRDTSTSWGAGFINMAGTNHLLPASEPAPVKATMDAAVPEDE
jgi:alkaline phosphatase D